MDFNAEVGKNSPFWNEISKDESAVKKLREDVTGLDQDEHICVDDLQTIEQNEASGKNAIIAGFFYFMAFVMFFTELRIVSLLHCIFGTMFMFFYRIGVQVGDE
jgi:hypothetical protein